MGLLYRFASQWVAGEELEAALDRVAERNGHGMGAILNVLGEHHKDKAEVEEAVQEYVRVVKAIRSRELDACVSIKLTQLGLIINEAFGLQQAFRVLQACRDNGQFLWVDMESSGFTDATIRIYRSLHDAYSATGVCLQANLRRTRKDLEALVALGGRVRLVKGAYREDERQAFRDRREVDANTLALTRTLFQRSEGFAIGSHDGKVVDQALVMSSTHPRRFEFQFLLGVREPLKRELVRKGFRVVEYVPYGPNWLPYFTRRLRERPRNILTMVRSLLSG